MDNNSFYEKICDIHVLAEGYQGGYMVRVVYSDKYGEDEKVYHVDKDDIINILQNLHSTVASKGKTAGWDKFWPRN